MYWEKQTKHNKAHFHAVYNEYECVYELPGLEKLAGTLPVRADRMVRTWAKQHKSELMNNWDRIQNGKPLNRIEPLE